MTPQQERILERIAGALERLHADFSWASTIVIMLMIAHFSGCIR